MNCKLLLIALLLPLALFPQGVVQDSVYGNVKSVREKLIYLKDIQQNKSKEDDMGYGTHPFEFRPYAILYSQQYWYKTMGSRNAVFYKEYDTEHKLVKETWYYPDNTINTIYEFKYNENGKLIEEKEISNGYTNITNKAYDDDNRLITILSYYTETPYVFKYVTYNKKNLVETEELFSRDKGKENILRYEYNNEGQNTKKFISLPYRLIDSDNPKIKSKGDGVWTEYLQYEYEYDTNGNRIVIKNYEYIVDGNVTSPSIIYLKYDKNNNIIDESYADNKITKLIYKYDDNKNLLEDELVWKNKTNLKTVYKYKNNWLVKLTYTEGGKTNTATYTYIFDKNNNWTEQTKSINGKPLYTRKREIIYY